MSTHVRGEQVKWEKHLMPTIDDPVADIKGATVFSKLDLSAGYHHLELAPESRTITTFSTHIVLRRYERLLFGIKAASEIFQNAIEEILTGSLDARISPMILSFKVKLRRNVARTVAAYWNGSSSMTCAWIRRIGPSRGVKSSSTDRFSARTELRQTQPRPRRSLTWANQEVSAR